MARAEECRRLALALAGTTEASHMDRAAFRVDRIYATLAADGRSVNLKFTPDEQAIKCRMAPDAFAPVANAWGRQGWTTALLAAMTEDDLRVALQMAWAGAPRPHASRATRPTSGR